LGYCSDHVICIRTSSDYLSYSLNVSCSKGASGKPPIFQSLRPYLRIPWYWGLNVTGCWCSGAVQVHTRWQCFGSLRAPHIHASGCTRNILEKIGGTGPAPFNAPIQEFTALALGLGLGLSSLVFYLRENSAEHYYSAALRAHFLEEKVTAHASEMG
jgi:hypothetical protein